MTIQEWDPDQALLLAPSDADEDEDEDGAAGAVDRYGVTVWESSHHEPLSLALSQEEPDTVARDVTDDQWLEADGGDAFPGRLVEDAQEADDDYAVAVVDPAEYAPEERAMHLES